MAKEEANKVQEGLMWEANKGLIMSFGLAGAFLLFLLIYNLVT